MVLLFSINHSKSKSVIEGYVDWFDDYSLTIVGSNYNTINISLEDFKRVFSLEDCKFILVDLVKRCYWSDISIIKSIRAKTRLSCSTNNTDLLIEKLIKEYLLGVLDIHEITHCILYVVCKEAENKGVTLRFT